MTRHKQASKLGRIVLMACAIIFMQLTHANVSYAKIYDRMNQKQVAAFLNGMGVYAKVHKGKKSKKKFVLTKFDNLNGNVILRNCVAKAPIKCHTLLLFVNFNLKAPATARQKRMLNRYNDRHIVGRAYHVAKSKGKPGKIGIDMRLSLKGGVTDKHIREEFKSCAKP